MPIIIHNSSQIELDLDSTHRAFSKKQSLIMIDSERPDIKMTMPQNNYEERFSTK